MRKILYKIHYIDFVFCFICAGPKILFMLSCVLRDSLNLHDRRYNDQAEDSEEQLAPVPVIKKKATGAKPAAAEVKKKKKESDATPAATAEDCSR